MKYDELAEINRRLEEAQTDRQIHINKFENDCVSKYEKNMQRLRIEYWADQIFILKSRRKLLEEAL